MWYTGVGGYFGLLLYFIMKKHKINDIFEMRSRFQAIHCCECVQSSMALRWRILNKVAKILAGVGKI